AERVEHSAVTEIQAVAAAVRLDIAGRSSVDERGEVPAREGHLSGTAVASGRQDDLPVLDGAIGRIEADRAAEQDGECLLFGNRDHGDAVVVGEDGVGGATGLAGVDDAVAVGGADIDLDVEEALVHRHRDLFAGDVSGGSVHSHGAALLDARPDQGDVAVRWKRVDLRSVHDLDFRGRG